MKSNTKKKKHTARIVDPKSANYTFVAEGVDDFHINNKQNDIEKKQKDIIRRSINDLKNQNRYKTNSKNSLAQQNHSPVYE
ncbi:MAG: hypothetical protein QXN55_08930 [Candidatus Nitrosotenuis sp.]